jgi:hypothetical protein
MDTNLGGSIFIDCGKCMRQNLGHELDSVTVTSEWTYGDKYC